MKDLTSRQLAAIREASRNRLSYASATERLLTIAGKDYSGFLKAESGALRIRDQEGPAVVLEGTLQTRLPLSADQEECRVDYLVKGERIPGFLGKVVSLSTRGYRTNFLAATPFYDAPTTPIGEGPDDDLDYLNAAPTDALYELASRVAGYRAVEIPRIALPRFTAQGGDAFRWNDYVSESVEVVEGASGIVFEDTPLSVATARAEGTVLGDAEPEWTFEEGIDFDFEELEVSSRQEGRYARVVAWRELADGTVQRLASAEVDNGPRKVDRDATSFVEHADGPGESAHQLVRDRAHELGQNEFGLAFPCRYIPVGLARGAPVLVRGRERIPGGTIVREYRSRLTGVSPDIWAKKGQLTAVGTQTREVFEASKREAARPRADAVRPPLGRDWLGRPYLSTSLPWVSYDPVTGRGVIDREKAKEEGFDVYYDEEEERIMVAR
ncbi:hypothetical protein GBA65_14870 [Rubrobacter marinus]|uniref:Uncharacterized protein n=1 Tax=Rubrobacter marinus TaxID=2653852 RepID=A0A6G8PZC5_9ACTN|nr:hypothetical protein [Rubrobacter marinus]QIN79589.1 hypothetical protein GBA65_14870 [Rubrobacter marinus]